MLLIIFHSVIAVLAVCLLLWMYMAIHKQKASLLRMQEDVKAMEVRCEKAEKANRMKDFYVQNMSHEIRTPLNAVMGFSQLLSIPGLPVSDEEKERYSQHIQNNGRMLMMLVDDILNISDIESGVFSFTKQRESVNDICRSSLAAVEYRVPPAVKLDFTTDVDDSYCVETDARRVQQVLTNYLTNACKHTHKGSITLNASLSARKGWLTFSVTDTGTGVKPEEAENIFDRFVKLNNSVEGTGIGLNICSRIAQLMNGKVSLDTSYTGGARFIFEIPL